MARLGRSFPGNRNTQYKYNALFLPLVLTPASITFTGQTIKITVTERLGAASVTFTGQVILTAGTSVLSPATILFVGQQISLNYYLTPPIPAMWAITGLPKYEATTVIPRYSATIPLPVYSATTPIPVRS